MKVTINKCTARGSISAPPSKSMAHRYLICGALSQGSVIENIDYSDDILATLNSLANLGAEVEVTGNTVKTGRLLESKETLGNLNCNESGSTLRFLIPLCLLFDREITLTGTKRLFERSMDIYKQICDEQDIKFLLTENSLTVKGRLKAGTYNVRGDVSSQFISGLMFALSTLEGDSKINITSKIESGSYIDMTVNALADFGVEIIRDDDNTILIKGNQTCKPQKISVEGDYSNAAFFDAFNNIGGCVEVTGLRNDTRQGDSVYRKYFKELKNGTPTVDISDCPDLAPVLMALAAANNGVKLTGTHRLKIKESDRGTVMAEELNKFGCNVNVYENEITVNKCNLRAPTQVLCGHNDHRIVMALSILLTVTGGTIDGAQAVNKSLPDFFKRLSLLGVESEVEQQ